MGYSSLFILKSLLWKVRYYGRLSILLMRQMSYDTIVIQDETLTLIVRLRQNVIKTAVR